jgi:hypothetical protein
MHDKAIPDWLVVARERDAHADAEMLPRRPGRVRYVEPMPLAGPIFARSLLSAVDRRALATISKLRRAKREIAKAVA